MDDDFTYVDDPTLTPDQALSILDAMDSIPGRSRADGHVVIERFDAEGQPNPLWPFGHCAMSGHHERGCTTRTEHMALVREGVGFSNVPGPSDRDLAEETANDHGLVRDEFHGRAPGRW